MSFIFKYSSRFVEQTTSSILLGKLFILKSQLNLFSFSKYFSISKFVKGVGALKTMVCSYNFFPAFVSHLPADIFPSKHLSKVSDNISQNPPVSSSIFL